MSLFDTLLLTPAWDLTLDASRNIAVQTESAAVAQDVASACAARQGEAWLDLTAGLPYGSALLGEPVNVSLFVGYYEQAARKVPGVVAVQAVIGAVDEKRIMGVTVNIIDETGVQSIVAL